MKLQTVNRVIKMKKLVAILLSMLMCFSFTACNVFSEFSSNHFISSESTNDDSTSDDLDNDNSESSNPALDVVTVTFKQAGKEDVIKTVERGSELLDVPTPAKKTGYTVTWDKTDFSNIQTDITVLAVEVPKSYTVTLNANGGTLSQTTFTIKYGQAYTLAKPTHDYDDFLGWTYNGQVIGISGVWNIDEDDNTILLIANWDVYTGDF